MSIDPDIQVQLNAAANSADRANKPTRLIVIAVLVLLAGGIFALVNFSGLIGAEKAHDATRAREKEAIKYVRLINAANDGGLDYATLFPKNTRAEVHVDDSAKMSNLELTNPKVNDRRRTDLGYGHPLHRADLACTVSGAEIDDILQWITNAVSSEQLKNRLFVKDLVLTALPTGWRANFTLSFYEMAQ